jgi:hypothetical protein
MKVIAEIDKSIFLQESFDTVKVDDNGCEQ